VVADEHGFVLHHIDEPVLPGRFGRGSHNRLERPNPRAVRVDSCLGRRVVRHESRGELDSLVEYAAGRDWFDSDRLREG